MIYCNGVFKSWFNMSFLSCLSTGTGESEEESDLAVLLALFIPLAATVTAIFIIALFVR